MQSTKNNLSEMFSCSKLKMFRPNFEFIDSINSLQSSWRATHYKHYEDLTLQDMYMMAGGPKSKIAG